MKTRLTYLPIDMYETIPWIQGKCTRDVNSLRPVQSECDYKLLSIMKLLHPLTSRPHYYTEFHYNSGFRMKKSFHNHIDFCTERGFIIKNESNRCRRYYSITQKGIEFYKLLS